MAGYDVDVKNSSVYNKHGRVLTLTELRALVCSICGLLLAEAMQVTQCGHRFCKDCIETQLRGSSPPYLCPVDKEEFQAYELRRDRGCQKEIEELEVNCPIQPKPCSWRGPLSDINAHKEKCPNAPVLCSLHCGLRVPQHELTTHIESLCPKRPTACSHCGLMQTWDNLEKHYQTCEESPTTCEHCQEELPSRKLLKNHLENDCAKYTMKCPMGCPDFHGKRMDLDHHLQTHLVDFAILLLKNQSYLERLEGKLQETVKTAENLKTKLNQVTKNSEEKDKKISQLQQSIESMQKAEQLPAKYAPKESLDVVAQDKAAIAVAQVPKSSENHQIASKHDASKSMEGALCSLGLPGTSVSLRSSKIEEPVGGAAVRQITMEFETQQTQLLKMNDSLQSMQSCVTQHSVAIDEVRLRQDVLDIKTTHGILIWKIPDIRRRYREATENRILSLYSPPFYTSPHGYRMCIRTYLNGDGTGKGTHLSLFFVLMRSEHDNLLSWPFKQKVRFTLINQRNPALSITEVFVPDQKSPSFNKPENDMNIASGFPKFARQSVLQDDGYTLDNVIYIKCHVDLSGLSSQ